MSIHYDKGRYRLAVIGAALGEAKNGTPQVELNVEVGDSGGNRSLGESQKDVTIAPRWHMSARLVGGTIARQLLAPFLRLNRHLWDGHVFVPMMNLLRELTPTQQSSARARAEVLRRSIKRTPYLD